MIDDFLTELLNLDVLQALIGSLIAGAFIGLEREAQRKAAGLRTHTLVCFAASLMTLLSLRMSEWHIDLPEGTQIVSDMSRMPHAILTGIGFLGAGVIFRNNSGVKGLTTAASLWVTAALGIVFGTGLVGLAALGTVITLLVLYVLRLVQRMTPQLRDYNLTLILPRNAEFDYEQLCAFLAAQGWRPLNYTFRDDQNTGERHYTLRLRGQPPGPTPEKLLAALSERVPVKQFALSDHQVTNA